MTFETKQKKRKAAASAPSPTAKKAKPATRSRKKAADFMSDSDSEEGGWEALEAKKKKVAVKATKEKTTGKKGKKEVPASTPATEKDEKKEKKKKTEESNEDDVISLDAVDVDDDSAAESEEEEIDDQTATLLKGFESSDEEEEEEAAKKEVNQFDKAKMAVARIPDEKKVKKKVAALKGDKSTPGVLYLGRIPHGFYEQEMRSYFSQFGTLTRLRLSRNKKTGHSKHYAFLEFADYEVARIVAETMDNYLLFGHILKCKTIPRDDLEFIERLFKGANKRYKPRPGAKIQKAVHERKRTAEEWEKKESRERGRRRKINDGLKAKGIDYEFDAPEVRAPEIEAAPVMKSIEVAVPQVEVVEAVVEKAVETAVDAVSKDGINEVEVQVVIKKAKKAKILTKSSAKSPASKVKKTKKPSKKLKA